MADGPNGKAASMLAYQVKNEITNIHASPKGGTGSVPSHFFPKRKKEKSDGTEAVPPFPADANRTSQREPKTVSTLLIIDVKHDLTF